MFQRIPPDLKGPENGLALFEHMCRFRNTFAVEKDIFGNRKIWNPIADGLMTNLQQLAIIQPNSDDYVAGNMMREAMKDLGDMNRPQRLLSTLGESQALSRHTNSEERLTKLKSQLTLAKNLLLVKTQRLQMAQDKRKERERNEWQKQQQKTEKKTYELAIAAREALVEFELLENTDVSPSVPLLKKLCDSLNVKPASGEKKNRAAYLNCALAHLNKGNLETPVPQLHSADPSSPRHAAVLSPMKEPSSSSVSTISSNSQFACQHNLQLCLA